MSTTPLLPAGRPAVVRPGGGAPAGGAPARRIPDRSYRRIGAARAAVGVLAGVLALGLAGCSDDGGLGGSDSGSGSGSTVEE